jgi:hypothetical protein
MFCDAERTGRFRVEEKSELARKTGFTSQILLWLEIKLRSRKAYHTVWHDLMTGGGRLFALRTSVLSIEPRLIKTKLQSNEQYSISVEDRDPQKQRTSRDTGEHIMYKTDGHPRIQGGSTLVISQKGSPKMQDHDAMMVLTESKI